MLDLPESDMDALRVAARRRIAEHFTLQSTIAHYAELYEEIVRT